MRRVNLIADLADFGFSLFVFTLRGVDPHVISRSISSFFFFS